MKILKSHRDHYFLRWNEDDLVQWGQLSNTSSFDYVAVDQMQRGDVTQESEKWLKKNAAQNFDLLGALRVSIPRDGTSGLPPNETSNTPTAIQNVIPMMVKTAPVNL